MVETIETISTTGAGRPDEVLEVSGSVHVGSINVAVRSGSVSVAGGSVGVSSRKYGSVTLFSAQHIGPGSTLTGAYMDVSDYHMKTLGVKLVGGPGSIMVDTSFVGTPSKETYYEGDTTKGSLDTVSFTQAVKWVRGRVYSGSAGTVDMHLGLMV